MIYAAGSHWSGSWGSGYGSLRRRLVDDFLSLSIMQDISVFISTVATEAAHIDF